VDLVVVVEELVHNRFVDKLVYKRWHMKQGMLEVGVVVEVVVHSNLVNI